MTIQENKIREKKNLNLKKNFFVEGGGEEMKNMRKKRGEKIEGNMTSVFPVVIIPNYSRASISLRCLLVPFCSR